MTIVAPPPPATPTEPAPPPLTPGGRTAVRIALVTVAAVAVAGTVAALALAGWATSAVRVVADTTKLPADLRTLTIDTGDVASAVRIVTDRDAREPTVSMRQVKSTRSTADGLLVTGDADGTRVTVSERESSFLSWVRAGELTVTLPPDLARRMAVTVQQDDGVLIAQADLDQLTVHNTDGAIVLGGNARRVDVNTRDGRVVTQHPVAVSESFVVRSGDGDVTVEFAEAAPRNTEIVSVDGDVSLALPRVGPYLVRTYGGSTQVRVPQTSDPARAVGQVTVSVRDGNATIRTLGN